MVANEKRLLSAMMAILMLVSMVTGFVLPVTASTDAPATPTSYSQLPAGPEEWPDVPLVPYAQRTSATDATVTDSASEIHYAITSAADWLAAVADSNGQVDEDGNPVGPLGSATYNQFSKISLWFTNDIDFDVDGSGKIEEDEQFAPFGETNGSYADIHGQGYAMYNVAVVHDVNTSVYGGLFGYLLTNATIRNLGLASGSITVTGDGPTTKTGNYCQYTGVFAGYINKAGVVYENCWNAASLVVNATCYEVDASVFGRFGGSAKVTIVNCYNIGDIVAKGTGTTRRVSASFDWLANTYIKCYNYFSVSTLSSSKNTVYGFTANATYGKAENVETTVQYLQNAYFAGTINLGNQSIGDTGHDTLKKIDADLYETGELAWMMNKNYTAISGYDRVYYTLQDEKTVYGTADNQTVRVLVTVEGGEDQAFYTNVNQPVAISHPELVAGTESYECDGGTIADGVLTLDASAKEATDLTVEVKATGLAKTDELAEKIAEIEKNGAQFYVKDEAELLSATTALEEAKALVEKAKILVADTDDNLVTVADVKAALATLNAYTYVTVEDDLAAAIESVLNSDLYANKADGADVLSAATTALAMDETDGLKVIAKNTALAKAVADYDAKTWTLNDGVQIPYKYYALSNFADQKDWVITDEADWRAATENDAHYFDDETLTLTNDIDMTADGDDSPVRPLCHYTTKANYFNGTLDGAGYVFKNLYVEETAQNHLYFTGLVARIGNGGVIKDLGIESGKIVCNWGVVDIGGGSNDMGIGGISGAIGNGGTMLHCWNAADVTVNPVELIVNDEVLETVEAAGMTSETGEAYWMEADVSVGGVTGRGTSGSLMDGCYNVGTVTGLLHASGLNDWASSDTAKNLHGEVYNSYNSGTVKTLGGLYETSSKVYRWAEGYTQTVRYATGAPTAAISGNAYGVGDRFSSVTTAYKVNTVANSNLLPVVAVSGELAYLLNTNPTNGSTYYYKVENGKTVHAKTDAERTFRITLTDEEGNVLYAYVNGGTKVTVGGVEYTITADTTITVTDAAHEHQTVTLTNNKNDSFLWGHEIRCNYETTIDGLTAYCSHADDVQESCTKAYAYVEGTADETHAHQARQYCSVCNAERIREHDADEVTGAETLAPGCESEGETTYTCSTCTYEKKEPISATGHDMQLVTPQVDPKCESTGTTAIYECANDGCDETTGGTKIPVLGHDYDEGEVTKEPSVAEEGERTRTCKNGCGVPKVEPIAKLPGLLVEPTLSEDQKEVTVDVSFINNGAKEATVTVGYDYMNMTLDTYTSELFAVELISDENGEAVIKLTATVDVGADAKVLTLTFKSKTNVQGNLSAFNGDYVFTASGEGTTLAGAAVDYEDAEEKTVTIDKGIDDRKGDLSRDGKVDMVDAILLLRYYNNDLPEEYATVITEEMADVCSDGDGEIVNGVATPEVNINDVIHMLRYLNGWIDTLEIQ